MTAYILAIVATALAAVLLGLGLALSLALIPPFGELLVAAGVFIGYMARSLWRQAWGITS